MRTATTAKRLIRGFKEARAKRSVFEQIREFQPKLSVYYESEDFIVKTVDYGAELLKVLRLRHEIFIKQWQGRQAGHGLDVDEYDFRGDHLIIIDKHSDEIVGTYRVLCSRFTDRFYSQNEFKMQDFLMWPWVKLELGRACVHNDYRNGNTIDLLWKGLSRYIIESKTKYLFGCASLRSTDQITVASVYRDFIYRELWRDGYRIRPTLKYEFKDFDIEQGQVLSPKEIRELIPPLLRSYLHAGAKVYGYPALDKEFACVDLFTVLDMEQINKKFYRRYFEF